MLKIGEYTQMSNFKDTVRKIGKKDNANRTNKTENANKAHEMNVVGHRKLSAKAQELLEKLKKTYTNMDFMVADYDNENEAKEILARGTKEFSVLFDDDELEKMAADEEYLNERISKMEGAVKFSERINDEFGYESVFDKNSEDDEVNRVGISYNQDGTMSYFAELEKVNDKQAQRIAKAKEKGKEDKILDNKENGKGLVDKMDDWYKDILDGNKKVMVTADSEEELYDMIYGVDWNEIPLDNRFEGGKFDYMC
jgi:peptidyl-tRNA hydrolase